MRNYKKEKPISYRSGMSNVSTFNCLNPDNNEVVMRQREWVNPTDPDFKQGNKQNVKNIIQMNRERVKQIEVDCEVQGEYKGAKPPLTVFYEFFRCI